MANLNQKERLMFDIAKVQKEARAELAAEKAARAKILLKDKLKQVAAAEQVLGNLRDELTELEGDLANRV